GGIDPASGIVRLPNVPSSYGQTSVSAVTRRIAATSSPTAAPTIDARADEMFWPISTLPVKAVAVPSEPTCSQVPPGVDHASAQSVSPAGGGRTTTSPSPSASK